jgi:hypothetical protein
LIAFLAEDAQIKAKLKMLVSDEIIVTAQVDTHAGTVCASKLLLSLYIF